MNSPFNQSRNCGRSSALRRLFVGYAPLMVALFFAVPLASAREIYVNNVGGSDLFDGIVATNTEPGHGPFQSITRALKTATAGDRIILANSGQPYRECISLVGSHHSCTAYQPFTIEGHGAVMDGSRPVPQNAWQHAGSDVFRFQPLKKQFAQLFLDGVPAERHPVAQNEDIVSKLQPKQWALADGWIFFRVEPGRLPQEYPLSYADLPVGITLYKVEGVVISDLTVQGFQLDGLNLNDAVCNTVLSGLTCRGNGRSGVAIVGATQAELQSCIVGDNGLCQLLLEGYSQCNLKDCKILDNTGPKWEIHDGAKLLIDGQPATRN